MKLKSIHKVHKRLLQQASTIGALVKTILVLTCLSVVLASCASTSVRVHPHRTESEIRNTIFQYTPIGSSRASVLDFINNRLRHDEPLLTNSTSIYDVDVGWYWTEFPLVPMVTHVYASWSFDTQNRLTAVTVVKDVDAP
jgi:hypothetical protein